MRTAERDNSCCFAVNKSPDGDLNDVKYLPATTYYQIKDVITDEIIVPFSDYTKVSCNSNGNYFKLNLTNWETNRSYYVEIKIDRSGVIEYFSDKDLTFTIEK